MRFLAVTVLFLVSACTSTWQFSTFEQIRLEHIAAQLCPDNTTRQPLCGIPLALDVAEQPNAYASVFGITLTRSLLQMMNDDEVAFALAHEIGHKVLHFPPKKPISREMVELEADRFAQFVTFCKGFDPFAGATNLEKLRDNVPRRAVKTKAFLRYRIDMMNNFDSSGIDCDD